MQYYGKVAKFTERFTSDEQKSLGRFQPGEKQRMKSSHS